MPRPELPWQVEPEEQPMMMVPLAEVTMLEMRHITETKHEVAIAKLEHETAPAEVTRFKVWGMAELECRTTVVEVPKAP
jgi:hypothetical protein